MSKPLSAEVTLEVPFHDLDPVGIVWHGNYARYFELARCALLESLGYNYDHMMASGYAWPLIDYQARYVSAARFKQRLTVRATIVEWEHRLKISYLIRDADSGLRVCKGHSVQVAVRMATGEMLLASPPVLLERLGVVA